MTKAGESILRGAREAERYVKSKGRDFQGRVHRVLIPDQVDVATIRKNLGMTQEQFAETFGFRLATVRDWEQHRRTPERPTRAFLKVIQRSPDAVKKALSA